LWRRFLVQVPLGLSAWTVWARWCDRERHSGTASRQPMCHGFRPDPRLL